VTGTYSPMFGEERSAVVVYMPKSLRRRLKLLSVRQDTSMSAIMRGAVERELKELDVIHTEPDDEAHHKE
jgi:hypothetical protein